MAEAKRSAQFIWAALTAKFGGNRL